MIDLIMIDHITLDYFAPLKTLALQLAPLALHLAPLALRSDPLALQDLAACTLLQHSRALHLLLHGC